MHPAAHPIARSCQGRVEHCAPPPRKLRPPNRPCAEPYRLLPSCVARHRHRRKPAALRSCVPVARFSPTRFPDPPSKPRPPPLPYSALPPPTPPTSAWRTPLLPPPPPRLHRPRLLPMLRVAIRGPPRDRRADRLAVMHPGQKVRPVGFDLHAPPAAKALLPAPEFAVHKCLIHCQPGRQP